MDNRKDKLEQNMSPANRINVKAQSCEQQFLQASERIEQRRKDRNKWATWAPDALQQAFAEDQKNYDAIRRHNKRYTAGGETVSSEDLKEY